MGGKYSCDAERNQLFMIGFQSDEDLLIMMYCWCSGCLEQGPVVAGMTTAYPNSLLCTTVNNASSQAFGFFVHYLEFMRVVLAQFEIGNIVLLYLMFAFVFVFFNIQFSFA